MRGRLRRIARFCSTGCADITASGIHRALDQVRQHLARVEIFGGYLAGAPAMEIVTPINLRDRGRRFARAPEWQDSTMRLQPTGKSRFVCQNRSPSRQIKNASFAEPPGPAFYIAVFRNAELGFRAADEGFVCAKI